jgi:hypothetical protein
VLYWALRRRFSGSTFLYSLLAYAGAIAMKYLIQIPTAAPFIARFGAASVPTGVYYGAQTAFLEVGLAYTIARFAMSRERLGTEDAEAFGIGLSFWENGVLLGILSLLNLAADYLVLAGGSTEVSQQVYQQLQSVAPQLFFPPAQALPSVGWGILERLSSTVLHISWGYLCVLSTASRNHSLLLLALAMGFADFLVPFAGELSLPFFEVVLFILSISCLVGSRLVTRRLRAHLGAGDSSGRRSE